MAPIVHSPEPDPIAYWRLEPVRVSKVRPTNMAVYCLATTELLHVRGGPEEALGPKTVDWLRRGGVAEARRDAEAAAKMRAALEQIEAMVAAHAKRRRRPNELMDTVRQVARTAMGKGMLA